nr:type I restriction endonuclease [Mycobacterium ostraviense]
MALHNEIEFEKEFAEHLAAHGWLYSPNDTGYDRERALFPDDVFGWLTDTQPEQLEKIVKPGSGDITKQQAQLLDRVVKVLDTPLDNGGGTLNLLRKGFSHLAAKFQMCVFKPESTLNEKRNAHYAAVRVRVMWQVHFSTADQRSVDLVFFVNGLPVATAELKTDFTQTVADAITQYKTSRLPKDPKTGVLQPLFVSGARAGALRGVRRRGLDDHRTRWRHNAFLAVQPRYRRRWRRKPAQPQGVEIRLLVGAGSAARHLAQHPGSANVHQA